MYRPASRPLMLVSHPALPRVIDVASDGDSAARTATHCKALLRTMGNVMSRRGEKQKAKPHPQPREEWGSVFFLWEDGSNSKPPGHAPTAPPLAPHVRPVTAT